MVANQTPLVLAPLELLLGGIRSDVVEITRTHTLSLQELCRSLRPSNSACFRWSVLC